jgi:C4-type Zn-finger protein
MISIEKKKNNPFVIIINDINFEKKKVTLKLNDLKQANSDIIDSYLIKCDLNKNAFENAKNYWVSYKDNIINNSETLKQIEKV